MNLLNNKTPTFLITHSFSMHPFSTLLKVSGFLMFSQGRERVHWEQMD